MTLPPDEFRGDNAKLVGCIEALIELSDDGALVPHGLGGQARGLLAAAANRLTAAEALAGRGGGTVVGDGQGRCYRSGVP